jgi:hypothetical protein
VSSVSLNARKFVSALSLLLFFLTNCVVYAEIIMILIDGNFVFPFFFSKENGRILAYCEQVNGVHVQIPEDVL